MILIFFFFFGGGGGGAGPEPTYEDPLFVVFFALILYVQSKCFGHAGTSLPGMNQW